MLATMRTDYDAARIESETRGLSGSRARICKAMLSLYRGVPPEEVSVSLGVMTGTVRRWAAAFNAGGFEEAFEISVGGTYDLRKDVDASALRLAADSSLYPGQKARYLAIASMYDGESSKDIARMAGVSVGTLSKWRLDFNRRGIERAPVVVPNVQAIFKANNRYYPLRRVVEVARRAVSPDLALKLSVIVMSYQDRSVEVIAEQKNVSRALVAAWIKSFNVRGVPALDMEASGLEGRSFNTKTVSLPPGHSAETLRQAANDSPYTKQRERLFAMATLYESGSYPFTERCHGIPRGSLQSWKSALARGGIEALSKRGDPGVPDLTETEVETALARDLPDAHRALIRAVADVISGKSVEEAATDWSCRVRRVAETVEKVRRRGASALVLPAASVLTVSQTPEVLTALASRTSAHHRDVLLALAGIASGKAPSEVITAEITERRLKLTLRRLEKFGERWFEVSYAQVAERARTADDIVGELMRWDAPLRSPFLMKVRGLLVAGFRKRPGLDQALAKSGYPRAAYDQWAERAVTPGFMSGVVTLGAHDFSQPDVEAIRRLQSELAKAKDAQTRREIAALLARAEGATKTTAAAIGEMDGKRFRALAAGYEARGTDMFDTARGLARLFSEDHESARLPFVRDLKRSLIAVAHGSADSETVLAETLLPRPVVARWLADVERAGLAVFDWLTEPTNGLERDVSDIDFGAIAARTKSVVGRTGVAAVKAAYGGASVATAALIAGVTPREMRQRLSKIDRKGPASLFGASAMGIPAPLRGVSRDPLHETAASEWKIERLATDAAAIEGRLAGTPTSYERETYSTLLDVIRTEHDGKYVSKGRISDGWVAIYRKSGLSGIDVHFENARSATEAVAYCSKKALADLSALFATNGKGRFFSALAAVADGQPTGDAAKVYGVKADLLSAVIDAIRTGDLPRIKTLSETSIVATELASKFRDPVNSVKALEIIRAGATSVTTASLIDSVLHSIGKTAEAAVAPAARDDWIAGYAACGISDTISRAAYLAALPSRHRKVDLRALAAETRIPAGEQRLRLALALLYEGRDEEQAAALGGVPLTNLRSLRGALTCALVNGFGTSTSFHMEFLAGMAGRPKSKAEWKAELDKEAEAAYLLARAAAREEARRARVLEDRARKADEKRQASARKRELAAKHKLQLKFELKQALKLERAEAKFAADRKRAAAKAEKAAAAERAMVERELKRASDERMFAERNEKRLLREKAKAEEIAEARRVAHAAKAEKEEADRAKKERALQERLEARERELAARALSLAARKSAKAEKERKRIEAVAALRSARAEQRASELLRDEASKRERAVLAREAEARAAAAAVTKAAARAERRALRANEAIAKAERKRAKSAERETQRVNEAVSLWKRQAQLTALAAMKSAPAIRPVRERQLVRQRLETKRVPRLLAPSERVSKADYRFGPRKAMRKDYDVSTIEDLRLVTKQGPNAIKLGVVRMAYEDRPLAEISGAEGVADHLAAYWLEQFNTKGLIGLLQAKTCV